MTQEFRTAYVGGPEPAKLSELRARTDRQVLSIVHAKLELGLNFVALAEGGKSAGDRAFGELSLERADQALADVQRLLPVLNEEQRRAFDPKFTELRDTLHRLGQHRASGMSYTASAFW
jgi:hypothetical protein